MNNDNTVGTGGYDVNTAGPGVGMYNPPPMN